MYTPITQGPKTLENSPAFKKFMNIPLVWISLSILCTFLWGSAFPLIKQAYFYLDLNSDNSFSLILFAGIRFTFAGILTLLISVIFRRQAPLLRKDEVPKVMLFGLLQTTALYTFFFVALANSTGVESSILDSSSCFMTILFTQFFFKNDPLTKNKILAVLLGIAGIIVLNIGGDFGGDFNFFGEGFMLISASISALSGILNKKVVKGSSPFLVTGWQLSFGGFVLILIGTIGGGHIDNFTRPGIITLLYLSILSAFAFTIWTNLVKRHSVTKVSIFKALVPIWGAVGSALILKENFFTWQSMGAISLIILSIVASNFPNKAKATKLSSK